MNLLKEEQNFFAIEGWIVSDKKKTVRREVDREQEDNSQIERIIIISLEAALIKRRLLMNHSGLCAAKKSNENDIGIQGPWVSESLWKKNHNSKEEDLEEED